MPKHNLNYAIAAAAFLSAFAWMFAGPPRLYAQSNKGDIGIISGNSQTGLPINTNIATPMVVTIHEGCTQAAKGCLGEGTVTWQVVPLPGKAQVYPASLCPGGTCDNSHSASVATVNNGQSTMYFHTNGRSGSFQITATNLATGNAATFTMTSVPGPPAQIVIISGSGQVGPPGPGNYPDPLVALVVDSEGNGVPGQVFVGNRSKGSLALLGEQYPGLDPDRLPRKQELQIVARDGLKLPSLLTLPPGAAPRKLPLVVLPHGGPQSEDTIEFDPWSSFVASRGYAVLQVNFRGSTGHGGALLAEGLKRGGVTLD